MAYISDEELRDRLQVKGAGVDPSTLSDIIQTFIDTANAANPTETPEGRLYVYYAALAEALRVEATQNHIALDQGAMNALIARADSWYKRHDEQGEVVGEPDVYSENLYINTFDGSLFDPTPSPPPIPEWWRWCNFE